MLSGGRIHDVYVTPRSRYRNGCCIVRDPSLTQEQVRLIKRFTPNITILYDGDPAGIKASLRGIDIVLEEGMNVKIVLLPDGEDPDSYSKKLSNEEFLSYLK
jgi:DNA primase